MRLVRRSAEEPQRGDELEALAVAARAALEHTDIERALDTILDAALQLVGADEGSVQLLDPFSMTLSVTASRGLSAAARSQVVAVGQGISGTVAVTGRPLLLSSAVDVGRFIGHVPKDRTIYGSMCVPLRANDETIGVLSVNLMQPGASFNDRDLRLVTLFAETAALAIVNSRLLDDTRRHAVELEMLRGATLRLAGTLDLESVAETALQEALAIASTDTGFICVVGDDGHSLELARYAGMTEESLRPLLSSPTFRRTTPQTDIRVVADVATDPVLASLEAWLHERALALVPLRTAEGRSGGMLGVALEPDASQEIRRLLATYATQAGLALSNALLHQRVASREEELATIVTALDLPIIMIDEDGTFRSINRAAAQAFHLSPEFEIGQHVRGRLGPDIEALIEDGDDVSLEVAIGTGPDERQLRVTVATVRHGRGAGARIIVLNDISSEREIEKRKSDFLAVIGHELRTPLTSIKGFAWTIARRGDALTPELRKEAINSIVVQSERLERLIEDLLYISRVEHHRPPLRLAWDDVVTVCEDIVAEMSRRTPNRLIRFDRPGSDLPIYTDRVKVEQMLAHLLDNAVKYSDDDRPVHIRIAHDDDAVRVSVRDEGPGIYSGDLVRIFEAFTQVDSSSTRRFGGTGVGLYVCKTLAEALGGSVEVDSVLGKGSTFTLVLPRKSGNTQES